MDLEATLTSTVTMASRKIHRVWRPSKSQKLITLSTVSIVMIMSNRGERKGAILIQEMLPWKRSSLMETNRCKLKPRLPLKSWAERLVVVAQEAVTLSLKYSNALSSLVVKYSTIGLVWRSTTLFTATNYFSAIDVERGFWTTQNSRGICSSILVKNHTNATYASRGSH